MIGPSTRVGISDLKSSIRNAILVQVQWDVVFLFDRTTSDYLLICKMDDKYKNMVLDTYTALLLVKKEFNYFVQREKDELELGIGQSRSLNKIVLAKMQKHVQA